MNKGYLKQNELMKKRKQIQAKISNVTNNDGNNPQVKNLYNIYKYYLNLLENMNTEHRKFMTINEIKRKEKKINILRNDLLKMTHSYDALKEKFQHFEKHDELRFKEIYDMKSKEARELALKVVLADRTIKTQQLGRDNIPNDNNEGFTLDELQKDQEIDEDENQFKKKKFRRKKKC